MKTIITAFCLAGLASAGFAQGVIYFDGSNNTSQSPTAPSEGVIFLDGSLAQQDLNVTLLGGATAGSLSPVVTLLLSTSSQTGSSPVALGSTQPASGDITSFGNGLIYDNNGFAYQFPTIGSGSTAFFAVQAWTGNYSSYAAAEAANLTGVFAGQSGTFTEVLASASGSGNDIQNMPSFNLTQVPVVPTPEPGTLALAGLGGFGMLMAMRRKKA